MKSIQNTSENSEYWSKEIDVNTRNVNGIIYKAKPWLTSSEGYSRFVRILPNGEEEVLFDNTLGAGLRTLLFVLGLVLLYVIAAICFIYNYIAKASIAGLVIKLINDRSKNDRKS